MSYQNKSKALEKYQLRIHNLSPPPKVSTFDEVPLKGIIKNRKNMTTITIGECPPKASGCVRRAFVGLTTQRTRVSLKVLKRDNHSTDTPQRMSLWKSGEKRKKAIQDMFES